MNKKLIVSSLLAVAFLTAAFSAVGVQAQSETSWHTDLIQKISARFGLKEADVQTAVDDFRSDRQAQMQSRFDQRLSQDVADGKITEDQKQLIVQKHQELQSQKGEGWQDLSPQQRQSKMQTLRSDLETWAKDNGIDDSYFFGGFGGRRGGGGCRFSN